MVRTTVYMPDELKRRIEVYAAQRRTTEAAVIRDAVERLLAPETDRSWVHELAGLGRGQGEDIADRVDDALVDSGFGEPTS